eukprot:gene18394-20248_t
MANCKGRGKRLLSLFKEMENNKQIGGTSMSSEIVFDVKEKHQFDDDTETLWEDSNVSTNTLQRHSSLESQSSIDSDSGCICNRNREIIKCDNCGAEFEGRIRKKCPAHKNVIHLMDSIFCHYCRAVYVAK